MKSAGRAKKAIRAGGGKNAKGASPGGTGSAKARKEAKARQLDKRARSKATKRAKGKEAGK